MSLPTREENITQEESDPYQDKRRLLSYWKSIESPTIPDHEKDLKDKDDLLEEFERSLAEMDHCYSHVVDVEKETNHLQSEQLSLLKHFGYCVQQLIKEKNVPALNDNLKTDKDEDNQKRFDALTAEKSVMLKENEILVKQLETQSEEYKSSSKEQQIDIEKLTREVQNFNISKRKLERELVQVTKLKKEYEATINSLRHELQTMKEKHDDQVEKLSSMNEQISKDNSDLVEKGKEATESLKIALQQLTEEKKVMQDQTQSGSGKSTLDLETSLERAKKEREIFRQRCEKSEMLQRNLQEEITSMQKELKEKEEEIKSVSQKNEPSSNGKENVIEKSNSGAEYDLSTEKEMKSAQSRILQLENDVRVLEDQVKERDDNMVSLQKEKAHSDDQVMEKSLELSRTKRILERKIERLAKENQSEQKRTFFVPMNSFVKGREENKQSDPANFQSRSKQQQASEGDVEKTKLTKLGFKMENKDRRKSNPERSAIQATLRRHDKVFSDGTVQRQLHPLSNNSSTKTEDTTNSNLSVGGYFMKGEHSSELTSVEARTVDVAPRRRIGGKFIRASSNRHSADLGKLMSRQELAAARRSDSDPLDKDEPATIFVNKYRKQSDEEHWV